MPFYVIYILMLIAVPFSFVLSDLYRHKNRRVIKYSIRGKDIRYDDPDMQYIFDAACHENMVDIYEVYSKTPYTDDGYYATWFHKDVMIYEDLVRRTCFDNTVFRKSFSEHLRHHNGPEYKSYIYEDDLKEAVRDYIREQLMDEDISAFITGTLLRNKGVTIVE